MYTRICINILRDVISHVNTIFHLCGEHGAPLQNELRPRFPLPLCHMRGRVISENSVVGLTLIFGKELKIM